MGQGSTTTTAAVKTAVIGASGYSGEELLRLLLQHPGAELACVTSRQHAGKPLTSIYPRFRGHGHAGAEGGAGADALAFSDSTVDTVVASGAEVVFLALPHGVAAEFAGGLLERGLRVIDLSADFRLREASVYEDFYGAAHPAPDLLAEAVYGMPEIEGRNEAIRDARLVASPGCYPTSILLPLIPLVAEGVIDHATIVAASMSGVSGAGRKLDEAYLFAECNESVRAYGIPKHRHLSEIEQELGLAAGEPVTISFLPHLVPVNAGICTTTAASLKEKGGESGVARVGEVLEAAYAGKPFVRLLGENGFPDTKNVVGTNYIDIGWAIDPRTSRCVLTSAEDNLGKGAASQAVQSFNLMCGLDEAAGLKKF